MLLAVAWERAAVVGGGVHRGGAGRRGRRGRRGPDAGRPGRAVGRRRAAGRVALVGGDRGAAGGHRPGVDRVAPGHPGGAGARAAAVGRGVFLRPEPDGMATLCAVLPALEAMACYRVLDAAAHTHPVTAENDREATGRRRIGDARADALLVAILGPDPTDATPGDPDRLAAPPAAPAVELAVVIDLPTLLGLDQTPAQLPGYGPLPAEVARALAGRAVATLGHRPGHRTPARLRPAHLPAPHRPGRLHPRPRHHLPLPRLRPPRHQLRPRPPAALPPRPGPRRTHQHRQPRRPVPGPPPAQNPPPLANHPHPRRHRPLDQPPRPAPPHPPTTRRPPTPRPPRLAAGWSSHSRSRAVRTESISGDRSSCHGARALPRSSPAVDDLVLAQPMLASVLVLDGLGTRPSRRRLMRGQRGPAVRNAARATSTRGRPALAAMARAAG